MRKASLAGSMGNGTHRGGCHAGAVCRNCERVGCASSQGFTLQLVERRRGYHPLLLAQGLDNLHILLSGLREEAPHVRFIDLKFAPEVSSS